MPVHSNGHSFFVWACCGPPPVQWAGSWRGGPGSERRHSPTKVRINAKQAWGKGKRRKSRQRYGGTREWGPGARDQGTREWVRERGREKGEKVKKFNLLSNHAVTGLTWLLLIPQSILSVSMQSNPSHAMRCPRESHNTIANYHIQFITYIKLFWNNPKSPSNEKEK